MTPPHDALHQERDRWLAEVAPRGWTPPRVDGRYNLVVIGGGPAGLVCAAGAAGLGAKVALIERHRLGGDCLNVGCVPSKGLIRAARAAAEVRRAGAFGVHTGAEVTVDFARVMERMQRIRADLARHDSARRFTGLGVGVFLGEGRFTGPDMIDVDGTSLRFAHAVIATGARPALPPIPGLAECLPLTNETVFDLTERPPRLAVIGAGPIGCELGQAFARFGSRVTLIETNDRIMAREEARAAAIVHRSLTEDGVEILIGTGITAARATGGTRTLTLEDAHGTRRELEVDAILVAAGRAPNVESLNLEAAGIAFDTRSGVRVDARLATSNRRVFAAGDVCYPHQFTHAADQCARIVLANALFKGRQRADRLVVPWATYTEPEVAHVGLTEDQIERRGVAVDIIEVDTAANDRSRLDGDDAGYARVYLKRGTDRILGATLVASHAGDMLGEMTLAITQGIGLKKIAATIHPYPTHGEMWKKVADAWSRTRLTPRVLGWMRRWLAFTR